MKTRTDVLVVGGGILGVAHAAAAVRAGLSVVLCERHERDRSASVRNFGMVWPIGQPDGVALAMARRSRELWLELSQLAGFRCEATGSLHLAHDDLEWAVLKEFLARSTLAGLQLLTAEECLLLQPALVPEELRGGLWSPHEANVDPPVAVAALHRWLAAQGAVVSTGVPVVKVHDGVVALANGQSWQADHVAICSGDEFALLFPELFLASDLQRCKLQMMSLGPQPVGFHLGPMLAAGLTLQHYKGFAACPSLPKLRARFEVEEAERLRRGIHVMASQGDDGRLIVGDSHEYGTEFGPGLSEYTEQLILDYLPRFLRAPNASVAHRWSGVYCLRRSGDPVLRVSPEPGVEIVTGVGGSGMTRSMALGEETIKLWQGT